MVGGFPYKEGRERKDIMPRNIVLIFKSFGFGNVESYIGYIYIRLSPRLVVCPKFVLCIH